MHSLSLFFFLIFASIEISKRVIRAFIRRCNAVMEFPFFFSFFRIFASFEILLIVASEIIATFYFVRKKF